MDKLQEQALYQSLVDLKTTQGWHAFEKMAHRLIEAELPRNTQFTSVDEALSIASRVCFVNGVKRALQLVNQEERLQSLKK